MSPGDRPVSPRDRHVAVRNPFPFEDGDVPLHREKLGRLRDGVFLVLRTIPVGKTSVADHPDAAEDHRALNGNGQQFRNEVFSIDHPNNNLSLAPRLDHDPSDWRYYSGPEAEGQLRMRASVSYSPRAMDITSDARWIADRLTSRFGSMAEGSRDPVATLILTILSQNTTDTNRDRAYRSLLDRFGRLDAVAQAAEREIADAIRVGGLQRQKARSIREALRRILAERSTLSIDFLATMDLDDALTWLLSLQGVGRKTAGIVLLFSFGMPYFPVDTHIRRVLKRVGWIRGNEEPHRRANAILPKDPNLMASLHLQLIRLGRTLCRPKDPTCSGCPILERCRHGKESSS